MSKVNPWDGSSFNPDPNSTVRPIDQCIESGYPVFACDLNISNAKCYLGYGYTYFINTVYPTLTKQKQPPCMHEVLRPNQPSRIFIDIDHKYDNQENSEHKDIAEAECAKFIEHATEECVRLFSLSKKPDLVILTGSYVGKVSYHVVIDIFLPDTQVVRQFVSYLKTTFIVRYSNGQEPATTIRKEFIDLAVYSRNHCFRLFGSSKKSNPGVSLQACPSSNCSTWQFETILEKSLIQCKRIDQPVFQLDSSISGLMKKSQWLQKTEFSEIDDASMFAFLDQGSKSSNQHTESVNDPELLQGLRTVIQLMYGPNITFGHFTKMNNMVQATIYKGVCPWRNNKPHKSNGQYFRCNLKSMCAYGVCSDSDCPKFPYNIVQDIRALLPLPPKQLKKQ